MPKPHVRNIKQEEAMAQSIFDDLGLIDDNRLPGWSFIHLGASEIIPPVPTSNVNNSSGKQSSEKKKPASAFVRVTSTR